MADTLIQFFAGGALLWVLVRLDFEHFNDVLAVSFPSSPKWISWVRKMFHIALSVVAAMCLLDPLIPGNARLDISVSTEPTTFPTLLEPLEVRVAPAGIFGEAGGDRTEYRAFDGTGHTEVSSKMALLETTVTVQLYDETQPWKILRSTTTYISPFVRRQLIAKAISFKKGAL
jgi:hypothetical protein